MSSRRPAPPHLGGPEATAAGARSVPAVPTPRGASRGPSGRGAATRSGTSRAARANGRGGARAGSTRPASRAAAGASRPSAGAAAGPQAAVPRVFTIRALVLFVVLLLAFVLLFPTVRAHLVQQAENRELAQQVADARERTQDLRVELDRWEDPAYVTAQARERLAFVRPGETAYRVVDPETVAGPNAPAVPATGTGPALVPEGTTSPWYSTIWESVRMAGEAEVTDGGAPAAPAPGISVAPTPGAPGAPGPAPAVPTPGGQAP